MKRKSVFYLLCVPAFFGLYGLPTLYICRNPVMPPGDAIRKGLRAMRHPRTNNGHLGVSGILFMATFLIGYNVVSAVIIYVIPRPDDPLFGFLYSIFALLFFIGLPILNFRIAKREWKAYQNQDKPYLGFMPPAKSEFSG